MKSTLLTSLMILCAFPLFTQTGLRLNWEKELINASGPSIIELIDVKPVSGGSVVAGNASTADGIQMYVGQYNNSGNLDWSTTLMSTESSSLSWIQVDNQGNIYVAGHEFVDAAQDPDIHYAKISSSGQVLWHLTYNGPDNLSEGMNDFVLANNQLYMCGIGENSQNTQHGWLAKFDLNGNLLWDEAFSPGVFIWFGGLAVDQAGNVSVVGSADWDYSFLAIQYDDAGNLKWQYPDTLTSGSEKWLLDVKVDDLGNVYAIGTEEVGAFSEYDIVTLKLDQNGNLEWKKNFNNGEENGGSILHIGSDERIYSFGSKEDNFDRFAQMIVYDTNGQKQWDKDYIIDGNTYIVGAELDANNDIYLAVQDFDSLGFATFSSSGNLLAAKNYGQEEVDYVSGFALSGTSVFGTAYKYNGHRSHLYSLQKTNLSENFVAEGMGLPLSDVNPRSLVLEGNALWLASYADDGDSASFTITKMDTSGNPIWAQTLRHETSSPSFPYLINDNSGNVIGLYANLINGGNTPMGLVKYDASGTKVFAQYLDSSVTFYPGGLAVDTADNIFMAAYNFTDRHMLLSLYDDIGNLQWTKTYLSPSTTFPYIGPFEIQISDQNKLVMAAVEKGADDKNNLHLIQFDLNGNIEWNVEVDYQTSNQVTLSGMKVFPNGNVCVLGSSGVSTWVAACYDQSGKLVWEHKDVSTTTGSPRSMVMDDQGNAYLCFSTGTHAYIQKRDAAGVFVTEIQAFAPTSGSFYFPLQCGLVNNQLVVLGRHLMPNQSVPFEMLLDANLNLIYTQVDSSLEATPTAIALDLSGNIYSPWAKGNQASQNALRSALVRKYSIGAIGVGLEDEWAQNLNLLVYPNPASEFIHVALDVPAAGRFRFSLYDISGRKLSTLTEIRLTADRNEVDLLLPGGLNSGIYLLRIETDKFSANRKLIIE